MRNTNPGSVGESRSDLVKSGGREGVVFAVKDF
jgi:hypothetical protein